MDYFDFVGSVKDSVVGEERIAQYLLAVLNTRGTPFHWKQSNNRRMEGIRYDSEEKPEYNLKDLRQKRKKPPNLSDVLYIEVNHSTFSPSSIILCLGQKKKNTLL